MRKRKIFSAFLSEKDGTARLWNAENGSSVRLLMKHDESIKRSGFFKDESRILTWSDDGTAMDDLGNVRALNKEEWETRKQEYIRISEDHLKTCKHKSANIYLNRQQPFWGK